jgi:CDP-glucose 4,6-dehydratase
LEDFVVTSFWRGRRVFLTGHTGFKGAWLALWLTELGAEVTGFALPPETKPSLFELGRVSEGVNHFEGDIRDLDALIKAMRAAQPEIVLHLAAQALVRRSYDEPVETYATNVMGTVHLLEAVRQVGGVRSVVCVTSDKCYENRDWVRSYRESDAMGGFDPYSSSKGCSELVASAYRRSYFHPDDLAGHGVAVATARAGNVIGGGDWAKDRLIPDLLQAFSVGERPLIRFPDAIRPWQHVLEPLSGYLMLAERLWRGDVRFADSWNFGPSDADARPVRWIADRMAGLWGASASWIRTSEPQPHEATYLKLDCSKAADILGWRPTWDIEVALQNIVAWTQANLAGADMRSVTVAQIQSFSEARAARLSAPGA